MLLINLLPAANTDNVITLPQNAKGSTINDLGGGGPGGTFRQYIFFSPERLPRNNFFFQGGFPKIFFSSRRLPQIFFSHRCTPKIFFPYISLLKKGPKIFFPSAKRSRNFFFLGVGLPEIFFSPESGLQKFFFSGRGAATNFFFSISSGPPQIINGRPLSFCADDIT